MRIEDWNGESGDARWWLRALGFATVLGIVLGIFGPFGSYFNADLFLRIVGWTGNLVVGTSLVGFLLPYLTRWFIRLGLPRLWSLAVASLIAAAPVAGFADGFGHLLWPRAIAQVRLEDWYGQALAVEVFVILLWVVFEMARQSRPPMTSPQAMASIQSEPLPQAMAPILCLQMEDHYVRVHRTTGSTLELMPLHEAIARYATGPGLQVHRSWWVAKGALISVERDLRNWRLRLSNGLAVPVARHRVSALRAEGWLSDDRA